MGLFDFFKKKKEVEYNNFNQVLGLGYYPPIFSQFGSNIYASDVVQQAIRCIVQEMKKLEPRHVLQKNSLYTTPINDSIQSTLENPNPLMSTTDFIEKIIWQLFFNYNSFIFPVWKDNNLIALYPVQPQQVDFIQDKSEKLFIKMTFANEYESIIPYEDIIHIRYNYSVSEFMGGNEMGQPDHKALLESLELNKTLLEGVAKGLKSSFAINGVIKYNSFIDNGKTEEALKDLTERLNKNENGFLPLDMKGEFIPFSRQIALVDEATLKFIDGKILRHFGVSIPILTGDYTKEQYEAFFQKTIEPLIVTLNQAFTKGFFSKRESFGFGHKIIFYHDKLDFMSMNEKIQWLTLASNVGAITINEMRSIIGYAPYDDEELGNTPIMSKNFGNAETVKDMDKKDIDKNKTDDDNSDDNSDDSDDKKDGEEND